MTKFTPKMTKILPKSPYKANSKLGQVVGTPTRPLFRYAYSQTTKKGVRTFFGGRREQVVEVDYLHNTQNTITYPRT